MHPIEAKHIQPTCRHPLIRGSGVTAQDAEGR
jgi:hypothetical protein